MDCAGVAPWSLRSSAATRCSSSKMRDVSRRTCSASPRSPEIRASAIMARIGPAKNARTARRTRSCHPDCIREAPDRCGHYSTGAIEGQRSPAIRFRRRMRDFLIGGNERSNKKGGPPRPPYVSPPPSPALARENRLSPRVLRDSQGILLHAPCHDGNLSKSA